MQNKEITYLATKAQGNDSDAFAELIRLCTKDMYKTAFAILMNDEDTADAIQDAVLACWEKIHTLKQPSYFKTWLVRILIHKCYDIRKLREKMVHLDDAYEPAAEDHSNLEFREALLFLDDKYRIVVILFYSEGYKTGEIAEILNIPKSTVQTRLKRAREKLAEYYKS